MEKKQMNGKDEPAGKADENKVEKPTERLYHVRMSRIGDKMQYLKVTKVDPVSHMPLDRPKLEAVVETDEYRPDFERRGRDKNKFHFRRMGVVLMRKVQTFNRKGENVRVALRHGDAERWDENDIIHSAVEELDVPESLMPDLAEPFRLGQLVVDGDVSKGDRPARPVKPGEAEMVPYKP